jgi:hypothetical protein
MLDFFVVFVVRAREYAVDILFYHPDATGMCNADLLTRLVRFIGLAVAIYRARPIGQNEVSPAIPALSEFRHQF